MAGVGDAIRGVGGFVQSVARDLVAPLFSFRTAIVVLLGGLLLVAYVATLEGITNLVAAQQGAQPDLGIMAPTAVAVFLITIAMWLSLEIARRRGRFLVRIAAGLFYLFALIWSVGFGFGFWWSLLVSRSETAQTFEHQMQDFGQSLRSAQGRLQAVSSSVQRAAEFSDARAARENTFGGTCGIPSPPGDGPLRRARFGVARDLTLLSGQIQSQWISPVTGAITNVADRTEAVLTASATQSRDARTRAFDAHAGLARSRATQLNSQNATFARSFAPQIRDLASQLRISNPSDRRFRCFDPELATALDRAADDASTPITISVPDFRSTEGPQATREAFNRLWGSSFGRLAPALRIGDGETLRPNDWIALIAAIIVDIGIFFFTIVRPAPVYGDPGARLTNAESRDIVRKRIRRSPQVFRDMFDRMKFVSRGSDYLATPGKACQSEQNESPRVFDNALLQLRAAGLINIWRAWLPGVWPWRPVVDEARETLELAGWRVPDRGLGFQIYGVQTADLAELVDMALDTESDVASSQLTASPNEDMSDIADTAVERMIGQLGDYDYQIASARRSGVDPRSFLSVEIQAGKIVSDLRRRGYDVFGRAGERVDYNRHDVFETRHNAAPRGYVIEVIQRGVGKRAGMFIPRFDVIRAAKVIVSEGPEPAQGFPGYSRRGDDGMPSEVSQPAVQSRAHGQDDRAVPEQITGRRDSSPVEKPRTPVQQREPSTAVSAPVVETVDQETISEEPARISELPPAVGEPSQAIDPPSGLSDAPQRPQTGDERRGDVFDRWFNDKQ